jgi:hypothetical protein
MTRNLMISNTARISIVVLVVASLLSAVLIKNSVSGFIQAGELVARVDDGSASAPTINEHQAKKVNKLEARIDELEHLLRQLTPEKVESNPTPVGSIGNNSEQQHQQQQLLPRCETLMQATDSPFADGAFLTRASTANTWILRADGSRELQLPLTCRLKRYTSRQARQCLKSRHLSFIGDSLSRYQFISLSHFIERGEYPARFGTSSKCAHIDENGKPTCSVEPSLCMEGDWVKFNNDPWREFHSALGGSTDGGIFRGRFQCGCARGNGMPELTENALYVSDTGVKMSYIGEIGWGETPIPIRGWNFTDCSEKGTCRSTNADSDALFARAMKHDWDWNEPLHVALNGTLRHVLPDVDIAIYNRGHFGVLTQELAEKVMPLLHAWTGTGRCFYKTTTAAPNSHRLFESESTYIKDATFQAGCGLLDFGHLTDEFKLLPFSHPPPLKEENDTIWNYRERTDVFWDSLHFTPWVYEELNNMLLNVLCNGQKST